MNGFAPTNVKFCQPTQINRLPVLISVPHCAVTIPDDCRVGLAAQWINDPIDTDWFVDDLYRPIAEELGVYLLHASYSRYVIDLNRAVDGTPLYSDTQRMQTTLVPETAFTGDRLSTIPMTDYERERRVRVYYEPYYQCITATLQMLRQSHAHVALLDAHSIPRQVFSVRPEPFPDLMLGTRSGTSAGASVIANARSVLGQSAYSISVDNPFQGGNITRHFGNPGAGVHALQMEMSQDIYMDAVPRRLNPKKAEQVRVLLRQYILTIAESLREISTKADA